MEITLLLRTHASRQHLLEVYPGGTLQRSSSENSLSLSLPTPCDISSPLLRLSLALLSSFSLPPLQVHLFAGLFRGPCIVHTAGPKAPGLVSRTVLSSPNNTQVPALLLQYSP